MFSNLMKNKTNKLSVSKLNLFFKKIQNNNNNNTQMGFIITDCENWRYINNLSTIQAKTLLIIEAIFFFTIILSNPQELDKFMQQYP